MRKTIVFIGLATVVAAGCGGNSGRLKRDQAQYEVVQEGSAGGVATGLNPEAQQPAAPVAMTGTNADTTSNFTLPSTTMPPTAPGTPGTIAGTMPQPSQPIYNGSIPRSASPRPRATQPAPATPTAPPPAEATPAPPAQQPAPPAVDTAAPTPAPAPPAPADSADKSDKKDKDKQKDGDQPPATDTSTTTTSTQPPTP